MSEARDCTVLLGDISARLLVELSEPPRPVSPNIYNEAASPSAAIVELRLVVEGLYIEGAGQLRELTQKELDAVPYHQPTIRLRSREGGTVEHRAPDGRAFTVRDLLAAIEETERQLRPSSRWLGGIDVHHVYFEGLHREKDGSFYIAWGS